MKARLVAATPPDRTKSSGAKRPSKGRSPSKIKSWQESIKTDMSLPPQWPWKPQGTLMSAPVAWPHFRYQAKGEEMWKPHEQPTTA
ncbi:unnamed protein product [Macrosiphum euphorbiae]|uniref:Uncharacterized protein n=1 Tax=Macrosiphum euphorbiae TaxID=13131 RepID=A0AAV0WIF6_9HEMI|nr:unnamed protein product [Macrosiphum euphorbiae]